jgi:hypothetical protein
MDRGGDWRAEINKALAESKCFILLYTGSQLDWSWCFYEAGRFASKGKKLRPIYCLHPAEVAPPSPLANLETIKAEPRDLENWIRNNLCSVMKCRQPSAEALAGSIKSIETLVNEATPVQERVLKPYIWIEPSWPTKDRPDWNAIDRLPGIDFGAATVSIDGDSATQLVLGAPPKNMKLLPFLRMIACDSDATSGNGEEFWIEKFFEALQEATRNKLAFQEEAYFRHEKGAIYRPVVISYAKNSAGTACKLRVIFASAFGSPLLDSPTDIQRLSDGVRLAVRTRLEVLQVFLGRTEQVHRDKVLSRRRQDAVARRNRVGSRIIEAVAAITQEAEAHGFRPNENPPILFEKADQQAFEDLRRRGIQIWQELSQKAPEEDSKNTGEYPETERLLGELNRINDAYLALALPRLQKLLMPKG